MKKDDGTSAVAATGYEQSRQKRIKENLERLEKMGILDLSRKLRSQFLPPPSMRPRTSKPALPHSASPPRRSFRLNTMTRVNYADKGRFLKKFMKSVRNLEILIEEGSEPEIYTEVHEELLGDCKATWTLYVDGYSDDVQRIYDPVEGKSCHQCRQKILGRHTECSTCKAIQGQFCGDCLFMRYGENVIEANENPSWTCPVCRGICNCSRCRRDKGWAPTGSIYRKVKELGFKSVAHYLIQTRGPKKIQKEPTDEYPHSAKGLLSFADGESESTDGTSKPQSDYNRGEEMKVETENGGSNGAYNKDDNHEDPNAVDDDDDDYEPS